MRLDNWPLRADLRDLELKAMPESRARQCESAELATTCLKEKRLSRAGKRAYLSEYPNKSYRACRYSDDRSSSWSEPSVVPLDILRARTTQVWTRRPQTDFPQDQQWLHESTAHCYRPVLPKPRITWTLLSLLKCPGQDPVEDAAFPLQYV